MASPIDGGWVVITGASSGIGREIARLVGPRAAGIVLVARRRERLDDLAAELRKANPSLGVDVETCDLADRAATTALADKLASRSEPIDVLVNNAGVGSFGVFDMQSIDREIALIELNVTSLVLLTHALVRGMVRRGRGAILNISSAYGMSYTPGFAAYIGSKHFVTAFTDTLRADLSGTGVRVGQVCPGPVSTEFEANVGNFTGTSVPGFVQISGERCARAAVRTIDWNFGLAVPGFLIRTLLFFNAMSPRFLVRWLMKPIGRVVRKKQLAAAPSAPALPAAGRDKASV